MGDPMDERARRTKEREELKIVTPGMRSSAKESRRNPRALSLRGPCGRRFLAAVRLALTAVISLALVTGCTRAPRILREIPKPMVYTPGEPERWTLSNGLQVMFYPDNELPLVAGSIMIPGGSFWEGLQQRGVVSALGAQMRLGGAGPYAPDELDRELEVLAAEVSTGFGGEIGTVSFGGMSSDLDRILELVGHVIVRPRFDERRLEVWKGQTVEGIRRRIDDPDAVVAVAGNQILYGDSSYGRVTVTEDILAIHRADLFEAHRYFARPDGAILAVTGRIDRKTLNDLLERRLAEWRPRGTPLPPPPSIESEPRPGVYFVTLPFSQASVQISELGIPRHTPDQIAISAFNKVFGDGDFNSRLMRRVRTDLGLVYGIYGAIIPGTVRGRNVIGFKTKSESAGQAIVESLKELERLRTTPPPDGELDEAKRSTENSFVFQNENPGQIVRRKAQLKILGYPEDYDSTYVSRLLKVSPKDVAEVAKKRWNPERAVIIVIGNEQALASVRKTLAEQENWLKDLPLREVPFDQKLIL